MRRAQRFLLALMLGALASLLGAPATTNAGTPIGDQFLIRDEPAPVSVSDPAVAYNSHNQEYLAVVWNDRPGNDDIRAERVSKDGKLLGGFWVATGVGTERRYPDVAYHSQAHEYLVIWEEDGHDIIGQRVQLASVGLPIDIVLGSTGSRNVEPAIGYASTENKYLVVYAYSDASGGSIKAIALNSDGTAWGSAFDIEPYSTIPKDPPKLVYNHLRNEFLVVWAQYQGSYSEIRARRVGMAGAAGTLGDAFWITSLLDSTSDSSPDVATLPRALDGQYLVVWERETSPTDIDIYGQLVSGVGTIEGFPLLLATTTQSEFKPAVAGNESNQQYLALWVCRVWWLPSTPYGIFGRTIATNGDLLGGGDWLAGTSANHPAVAAGSVGDFLLTFEETGGDGYLNVWGRLWGNRLYLPLILKSP
ncbi:MAG: hypothetical protein L0Y55_03085 [Anaerolineales bacterium]|nr:hypothetical protein [Anaerolineales bacterium]